MLYHPTFVNTMYSPQLFVNINRKLQQLPSLSETMIIIRKNYSMFNISLATSTFSQAVGMWVTAPCFLCLDGHYWPVSQQCLCCQAVLKNGQNHCCHHTSRWCNTWHCSHPSPFSLSSRMLGHHWPVPPLLVQPKDVARAGSNGLDSPSWSWWCPNAQWQEFVHAALGSPCFGTRTAINKTNKHSLPSLLGNLLNQIK